MSKFTGEIIGGAELAAGAGFAVASGGLGATVEASVAKFLISAGAGQMISGLGTLLSGKGAQKGFATTERNPVAPWRMCYGRARTGGVLLTYNGPRACH